MKRRPFNALPPVLPLLRAVCGIDWNLYADTATLIGFTRGGSSSREDAVTTPPSRKASARHLHTRYPHPARRFLHTLPPSPPAVPTHVTPTPSPACVLRRHCGRVHRRRHALVPFRVAGDALECRSSSVFLIAKEAPPPPHPCPFLVEL
jgi:hypothetical protein